MKGCLGLVARDGVPVDADWVAGLWWKTAPAARGRGACSSAPPFRPGPFVLRPGRYPRWMYIMEERNGGLRGLGRGLARPCQAFRGCKSPPPFLLGPIACRQMAWRGGGGGGGVTA